MKNLLLAVLLIGISFSLFSQQIEVATLNWEPYIGEELDNQGFIAEIIKEAFKAVGKDVDFEFYPWNRTIILAKAGKVDAYGPEYYAESLKDNFFISDPFPGGPVGLLKLKNSDISYEKLEDLKPYKIGVVRGYVNEENFDAATYLNKEEVTDDLTNVRKLYGGRIDLFFADKYVARWLAKEDGFDPDKMEFIKPMVEHDLYLCFPKNRLGSESNWNDFNKGLKIINENGILNRIMATKGF